VPEENEEIYFNLNDAIGRMLPYCTVLLDSNVEHLYLQLGYDEGPVL
jgi:hypothetical protein